MNERTPPRGPPRMIISASVSSARSAMHRLVVRVQRDKSNARGVDQAASEPWSRPRPIVDRVAPPSSKRRDRSARSSTSTTCTYMQMGVQTMRHDDGEPKRGGTVRCAGSNQQPSPPRTADAARGWDSADDYHHASPLPPRIDCCSYKIQSMASRPRRRQRSDERSQGIE